MFEPSPYVSLYVARPTTRTALERVRMHRWTRAEPAVCRDCGLELTLDFALVDVPECPGPEFSLQRRTVTP